jgi:hypothetical protein
MRSYIAMIATTARLQAPADEPIGLIELEENLADVEKPPELPPNWYIGEVQDVQVQTSGKGNQYFSIRFVIPPDELPADIREHFEDGASMYWNRNIVPNGKDRRALFNLRKLIEAFGLDSKTTTIDPNEWMGRTARLRVVMGKWQGEDRAEIRSVEAAEAAPAPRREAGETKGPAKRGRK